MHEEAVAQKKRTKNLSPRGWLAARKNGGATPWPESSGPSGPSQRPRFWNGMGIAAPIEMRVEENPFRPQWAATVGNA